MCATQGSRKPWDFRYAQSLATSAPVASRTPLGAGCVIGALGATGLIESTTTRVAVAETHAATIPTSSLVAVGFPIARLL
jgi:hypothetical protein